MQSREHYEREGNHKLKYKQPHLSILQKSREQKEIIEIRNDEYKNQLIGNNQQYPGPVYLKFFLIAAYLIQEKGNVNAPK